MSRPPSARPKTSSGRAATASRRTAQAGSVVEQTEIKNEDISKLHFSMTWIFFGVTPTPIRPASRISISRAGPAVPTPPSRSGLASRSGTPQRIGNTLIGDRPMTGLARPPTVGVNPAVRPITQQGLSGGRAVSRLGTRSMRQVHDKSYFMGILRSKMNQLTAEITRLEEVYKKGERDRMELDAYEQRAKMSATELKELQGKLVDYNVLVDRMHMNHDVNEIEADARRAKETADEIEAAVQELFTERQAREREIEEITMEIDEQKRLNQAILAGMDPSIREHYESTKKQNEALKAEVEEMEKELKHLHERKDQLEMEVSNSPLKKKAIQMQQNLDELQSRERILLSEKEAQETPEEKKQRLIDQIKLNNDDISMMEKQIQKTSELINLAHEEISEFDSSADRNLAKNSEKYRELMMKEREYDEFLSAYDKQKQSLTIELDEYSEEVVRLLQKMSANILKLKMDSNLNAVDDDDDVTLSIQGNASIEELQNLYVRLQEESISLDEHRTSLQSEIETFDHRLDELSKQLAKYSDLDRISVEAENNIKKLENRRDELEKVLPGYEERCEELKEKLRQRTEQLEKNPKYTIHKNLLRKLEMLQENNARLRTEVEARENETNYEPIKAEVRRLRALYNDYLVSSLGRK
ncbi:hypothetical protein DICVIV_04354 [Dictyocaulus viviparus]|uniref:Intraflagellar transport protein 74 homolog n=1 Tax=Dictyocaulus viviparus TaxID=29172 RepID=A0A0D8XYE9_DICVI|nr:hypothetical protein DICVIV_04354 [Dictyocaulus viviparus]